MPYVRAMARPLVRTHRIEVRVSDAQLAALTALAAGEPIGPAMVAAALRQAEAPSTGSGNPRAALEAWERQWLPTVRRNVGMFGPVRTALDTLLRLL
jgi:hypothetical protein